MKNKKNKGFTLVELLAVIIILAIVVGITIPATLTTIKKARRKAFETAADTMADYIERQWQLYMIDRNNQSIDTYLRVQFDNSSVQGGDTMPTFALTDNLIETAGLRSKNIQGGDVKINKQTGRACVKLVAKSGGDYDGVGDTIEEDESGFMYGGSCS